ncbi:Inter-alpha-trypsin inhibitor heavy chain H5 [Acipenser ruthenus]|uniref:Inter-alpha-trypsin inhibitor heavy chain H5 n=1 Tax=Acipenser ruthenus TaxID=7906 RepID=A0A662YXD7_ACIRT|nr:Inter-alpha-trypsin inhibitor heavy chain H5 [Acipenser ruthenus]
MITIILLFCLYPSVLGEEYANLEFDDNIDEILSDLEPESVGHRVPRQVNKLESKPHIIDFKVKTTIISRYAFTAVSCTMINRVSAAKEGVFQIQIPAAAYISNFTMIIGGRVYPSEVREKEKKLKGKKKEAKKPGNGAKAGNIESEMETFQIAASIPGKNKATFLLAYEELLQRRLGKYEHVTSVRPQQLVSKLSVEVNIVEHSEITYLETPQLRNGRTSSSANTANPNSKPEAPLSTVVNRTKTTCKVTFSPNIMQQARIARNGMLGDFVVRYDVERELGIGDIQTKEALFTILKDLRPEDHFNIVSFSNRIKVWQQGKLVPVTPDNIRDAKKFIYLLSPSGGTNINGGIQTGAVLLSDYKASHRRTQGSVSLIIFLTDGRPTVGETQSSNILSNTKEAVQEQSCLFSIGIGNDVDYRLLERMALENCGMMRRIYEDADARTMLKGFYDEIGTPLLSDIHIDYTEDTVEHVTQKLFTNYFNGSEIVIAGKLSGQSTGSLHVQVKASNSDKSIMLETDVPLQEKAKGVEKNINSLVNTTTEKDYIERLWGYLSVKELLQSRLRSESSRERETLSDQAKNLSLTYNFVTPVTSMVIEQPDIQMDKPRDDDADLLDEEHGEKPQSLHRNTKQPADGDPHFVVDFPLSKMAVCFNINGEPGDVLRLVSDHKNSGVTVNGKLIGAPAPVNSHKKQRTYFSTITIMVSKPQRSYIEITPRKVILDSKDRMVLPCDKTSAVERDGLAVSIVGKSNITVTVQGSVSFVILVHHYKNPAPYQRDHLGFYISSSKGLSSDSHGLLGQFLYQEVSITEMPVNVTIHKSLLNGTKSNQEPQSPSTALKLKDRLVPAVKKQRKIHSGRHQVDCWFVKNNAAKLIDGVYQDYVVSHLFDTATGSNTSN